MKIVIVGPAYPLRGGNALFVAHLYDALSESHEVHVVSYSRLYPGILFPGVRQTDISGRVMKPHPAEHIIDSANPLTWMKAARRVVALNPDLLVITWWNPFFGLLVRTIVKYFRRKTQRPVLIVVENVVSHEARAVDIKLTNLALSTANAFLALSGVVENSLKKLFPRTPVFRSALPVYDCYAAAPLLSEQDAQKRLGIPRRKVILFFGYVRRYKGLMNLLEALPAVLREVPDAHLLVVGEFYDDPAPYHAAVRRLGISSHVTIYNEYVANETVHRYFTAANLVVLPYNEATQSGILSIAQAFDRPAVVTEVGGLAELVQDGETGYVVPPNSPAQLAAAIVKYFRCGNEKEFAANVAARRRGSDAHSLQATFDAIAQSFGSSGRQGMSL